MKSDVFVCHASEDKWEVAKPLADMLQKRGFAVWYDEYVMKLGDSLTEKIDEGLAKCRFGVVVLSPTFFRKNWARRELTGLVARETTTGHKLILPVWHNVDKDFVQEHSPTLADRLGAPTSEGLGTVVNKIVEVLEAEMAVPGSRSEGSLVHSFTVLDAEREGCPRCGGTVTLTGSASESGEFVIGTCQKCGWEDYYP